MARTKQTARKTTNVPKRKEIPGGKAPKPLKPSKRLAVLKMKKTKTNFEDDDETVVKDDEVTIQVDNKIKVATDFTQPQKSDKQLKIVSWNVAGFRACIGKGFQDYVIEENPDILCLQETKIKQEVVKDSDIPPGYTRTFIHCTDKPGQHGVAVLIKDDLKPLSITAGISKYDSQNSKHDNEGRAITIEFDGFFVVNTYVPNAGTTGLLRLGYRTKEWDVDFQKYLKELDKTKPVVWCGDLNVAHHEIDLKNPKTNTRSAGFTQEERTSFGNFLNEGFIDSYRHYNPTQEGAYTFWSYKFNARAKNAGWRLDYFVVSKRFIDNIKTPYIRNTVEGSDHCPIGIIVNIPELN